MAAGKVTASSIRNVRHDGRRIVTLTAYDYPTARLLDETGVDILLVGDSVGMVMLGYPDTTHVTLEQMVHHTAAVARAKPRALVVADLPYQTYSTPAEALASASRLIDVGAEAVKFEGGLEMEDTLQALSKANIPVMGHLGMLPQSIKKEGGVYRIKGKTPDEREYLEQSMQMLSRGGAFAVVLELVKSEVAHHLTKTFDLPTIGIGSGPDCDGQVLVTPDLIGLSPWFRPKFVTPAADVAGEIQRAARVFRNKVYEP